MGRCALAWCAAFAHACSGSPPSKQDAPADAARPVVRVEEALSAIVATCAEATGNVEVRRKGSPSWEPARVGMTFRERDWVRTSAGAFARVRFSDRGFVDLPEHTTILVDSALTVETGTLVAVAEPGGVIRVKAADGSEARIVPVAGGPAAEVRLTPSQTTGLEIAVTKGNVTVVTGEGELAIATGEASDLAGNRASALVKLLGFPRSLAPGIDARLHYVAGKAIAFKWATVRGALRYRVQVARDTEFRTRVLDAVATPTTVGFTPDGAHEYVWRVAGIDADGRLGEFGFVRRMYFEVDPPRELLIAPADGAKVGFAEKVPRVVFAWRSAGAGKRYRLVIGRDAAPTAAPLVEIETASHQIEVRTLREGGYHWGVYELRADRAVPIFLAPRALTIRKQRVKAHTDKLWQDAR